MKSILIVDDEKYILGTLKRLFRNSEYEVHTALNGLEALEIMSKIEINLVISDMRMPIMDGYELLSKIKKNYPKTFRVILSGYSDKDLIFKIISENIAKLYLFKPWDNTFLLNEIEKVFKSITEIQNNELKEFIYNLNSLPTYRKNIKEINTLIEEEVDLEKIASRIASDQSISLKLLQIINSGYDDIKTTSIYKAVDFIGLKGLKSLLLLFETQKNLDELYENSIIINRILDHTTLTQTILFHLYEHYIEDDFIDNYRIVGLMHNIGIYIMLQYYGKEYEKFLKLEGISCKEFPLHESQLFNISHNRLGAFLLSWWDFPYSVIESALYHHDPFSEYVIHRDLLCALHLAQSYACKVINEKEYSSIINECLLQLNIDRNTFEESLAKLIKKYKQYQ